MHFGLIDYAYLDKAQGNDHRRRCIDGRIAGRCNCVGYCNYAKHPGFLTAGHCAQHRCAEKGCHYFLPKLKQEKPAAKRTDAVEEIVTIAAEVISAFEGMKIIRADKSNDGWRLKYITLSNDYPIRMIAENISEAVGETVVMINLNYDFETAAKLIFRLTTQEVSYVIIKFDLGSNRWSTLYSRLYPKKKNHEQHQKTLYQYSAI